MQISAFIATSLDGYIARKNHDIDWLENASSDATEDYGYESFIKSVSTVVMGRKTFERILKFPEWPFAHQRVIVLSGSLTEVIDDLADQVQLYNGDVLELVDILAAEGETHLYIDGGCVIQSFIAAGLLTNLTLTTIPVLIGSGIPLFGNDGFAKDVRLAHVETRAYQNGFVQTHYLFT